MLRKPYSHRTPEDYLQHLNPNILSSFNPQQIAAVKHLLYDAIPKPTPKIVDLRMTLDLIVARYYLVIWVGKDRRKAPRRYTPPAVTRVGNFIVACLLLLALNLMVTASLFVAAYLLKSAAGIDLFPGHLYDYI